MRTTTYRFLIIVVWMALAQALTAQTVTIVAGGGTGGDNIPATSSELKGPANVTFDAAGNYYIADALNQRVRKVNINTGIITTAVGSGAGASKGVTGDGGPATLAGLSYPFDVTLDAQGNLYIADKLNSRIRKVDMFTGIITTIAGTGSVGYSGDGGPATSADLNLPEGIAIDTAGNIYIGDTYNNRIRKISAGTGIITTIAGTGEFGYSGDGGPAVNAQVYDPTRLAFDSGGNLFIADSDNNRIRRIDAATGIITTVAGSGPAGFAGDGGRATAAMLNNPTGIAIDALGNMYIADAVNRKVRWVTPGGLIGTIAGNEGPGCPPTPSVFVGPVGVKLNAAGTLLYVSDEDANYVRTVSTNPTGSPQPSTPSECIPRITSINPTSGQAGSTVSVNLTGTRFALGNNTTLAISGSGITVSDVNAVSETSMGATFTIAANATPGPRAVTVTTSDGTSDSVQFTVTPAPPPPPVPIPTPALTSVNPASGVRGTTPTVTLSGTDFGTSGTTAVTVSGSGITVSNVKVTNTSSLTATFAIASDAAVGNYGVVVTTAGGSSNSVAFSVSPQGPVITYGLPSTMDPTQQTPFVLNLANPAPDAVTGQVTLTFTPNTTMNADDPNVKFINTATSSRTLNFTFPANNGSAQLSLPSPVVQAGTVAGTIHLTMSGVQVGNVSMTPQNSTFDITIPRLVPVITSVRILNRSKKGFDVEITGFSTSKDINGAIFEFSAKSGEKLGTQELSPDVVKTFINYYQTPESAAVGSTFVYLQPFTAVEGDANVVASVTVTLSNSVGKSEAKKAN